MQSAYMNEVNPVHILDYCIWYACSMTTAILSMFASCQSCISQNTIIHRQSIVYPFKVYCRPSHLQAIMLCTRSVCRGGRNIIFPDTRCSDKTFRSVDPHTSYALLHPFKCFVIYLFLVLCASSAFGESKRRCF